MLLEDTLPPCPGRKSLWDRLGTLAARLHHRVPGLPKIVVDAIRAELTATLYAYHMRLVQVQHDHFR